MYCCKTYKETHIFLFKLLFGAPVKGDFDPMILKRSFLRSLDRARCFGVLKLCSSFFTNLSYMQHFETARLRNLVLQLTTQISPAFIHTFVLIISQWKKWCTHLLRFIPVSYVLELNMADSFSPCLLRGFFDIILFRAFASLEFSHCCHKKL